MDDDRERYVPSADDPELLVPIHRPVDKVDATIERLWGCTGSTLALGVAVALGSVVALLFQP